MTLILCQSGIVARAGDLLRIRMIFLRREVSSVKSLRLILREGPFIRGTLQSLKSRCWSRRDKFFVLPKGCLGIPYIHWGMFFLLISFLLISTQFYIEFLLNTPDVLDTPLRPVHPNRLRRPI